MKETGEAKYFWDFGVAARLDRGGFAETLGTHTLNSGEKENEIPHYTLNF